MVLAAKLSASVGRAPISDARRIETLLQRLDLPTTIPAGLDASALLARMRLDKKAVAGGLRFILLNHIGDATVVSGVPDEAVLKVLHAG